MQGEDACAFAIDWDMSGIKKVVGKREFIVLVRLQTHHNSDLDNLSLRGTCYVGTL